VKLLFLFFPEDSVVQYGSSLKTSIRMVSFAFSSIDGYDTSITYEGVLLDIIGFVANRKTDQKVRTCQTPEV